MDQSDSPDLTPATGDSDESRSVVRRRTVLLGSAAAAVAGVASVSTSADAAPRAAHHVATPLLPAAPMQVGGPIPATEVTIDGHGQISQGNVQDAMFYMDDRLAKSHVVDDLKSTTTLFDEFMGTTVASGSIGQLGWTSANGAPVEARILTSYPGIIRINTGVATNANMVIHLGTSTLRGCPVFVQETRCRLNTTNATDGPASVYFPLTDNVNAQPPNNGCYFRYASDSPDPQYWWAGCASAGARTEVRCQVPVTNAPVEANSSFHRFRVTRDGGLASGGGVVRFYIDGDRVAEITDHLPSNTDGFYGPTIGLRKNNGTVGLIRSLDVDYYALVWEVSR
jgi:hypothetical protein